MDQALAEFSPGAMDERAESSGTREGRGASVHQFVPALIPRDATGNHTLLLRDALRNAGWDSQIFVEATHDELVGETIRFEEYPRLAQPGDVLIYQFSTSSKVAEFLMERSEPLILNYHNVTAPQHYEVWEPATANRVRDAKAQLRRLAPRAVLGIADSTFNARELVEAGCSRNVVVPVLTDARRASRQLDELTGVRLAKLKDNGGSDWLFVGRLVPSKGQHDLIKVLWAYRRLYDPRARLHLVGSTPSRSYLNALRSFSEDLDLSGGVFFSGEISDPSLASYFAACDVYVSLSAHEGFGVPLIEAMEAKLPIVALNVGGVAETLNNAGMLIERKEPTYVATCVHKILTDERLGVYLARKASIRSGELSLERCSKLALDAISSVAPHSERKEGTL